MRENRNAFTGQHTRINRRRKGKALLGAVVCLLGIAAVAGLVLTRQPESFYDSGATVGYYPGKSAEQIQREQDMKVAQSAFHISVNPDIRFEDGLSAGVANIENIAQNHYDMQVVVTLDDGETIFESGAIAPGSYLQTITCNRDLDAGIYDAVITFKAYTRPSENDDALLEQLAERLRHADARQRRVIGQTAAEIQLIVEA